MFYEPSTRTRTSFNAGMRELGGRYDGFSGTEGTSVMKSETVRYTVTMMCANHNDVIVMRHPLDGSRNGGRRGKHPRDQRRVRQDEHPRRRSSTCSRFTPLPEEGWTGSAWGSAGTSPMAARSDP